MFRFYITLIGVFSAIFIAGNTFAQPIDSTETINEINTFWKEQDEHFLNRKTSPLTKKERKAFKAHRRFSPNLDFVVEAQFKRIASVDTITMPTVKGEVKYYQPYAKVSFTIHDTLCELTVYQSLRFRDSEEYGQYLFIPFRDATSGKETYGGGRYLDILIPKGTTVTLNFNLAYNPYCAYTAGYNCVIPPVENTLPLAVKAGAKVSENHNH